MLPPNLEILHVMRNTNEILARLYENIEEVMRARAEGDFMSLKSITVDTMMQAKEYDDWNKRRGLRYHNAAHLNQNFKLVKQGKEHGIKFIWRITLASYSC